MNSQQIIAALNQYSNAVLAILTLLLLVVTAFYAWVSFRLLRESVEARQAAVRPLLSLKASSFGKLQPADHERMAHHTTKWSLANRGRGPALAIALDLDHIDGLEFEGGMGGSIDRLEPLTTCDLSVNLNGDVDPANEDYSILLAKVAYEDLEGNLYDLRQRVVGRYRGQQMYWSPVDEELYFVPFSKRANLWPHGFGLRFSPNPLRKARRIYKRSAARIAE